MKAEHSWTGPSAPRLWLLLLGPALVLAGCKTPETARSSWLASVLIPEKTAAQIRVVATSVFQRAGYVIASAREQEIVLEKPAGPMQNALYGDLTSGVWVRVKLRVRPYGPEAHLLECNAYRVSDKGDRAFEREQPYRRAGPWQKLLDEVKAQLLAPGTAALPGGTLFKAGRQAVGGRGIEAGGERPWHYYFTLPVKPRHSAA